MATANEISQSNIVEELSTALLCWYPFRRGTDVIIFGKGGAMAAMLRRNFDMRVTVMDSVLTKDLTGKYDYIIAIEVLELVKSPVYALNQFREILNKNGTLLLGMNNRLGLKFFCGDHEPYTGRSFDGVEEYRLGRNPAGRLYARDEIEKLLREAGWSERKFYAVLPNLTEPVFFFADGQIPLEDLTNRFFPNYNYPWGIFLEEARMYRSIAANGMFHAMANAYLVECSPNGNFADVLYVTTSMERGKENALVTTIHENGSVTKKSVYAEGRERLVQLDDNMKFLQQEEVPVVAGEIKNDTYIMPCVKAPTGQTYMRERLLESKDKFLEAMDKFREEVLSSSPIHTGEYIDDLGEKGTTELFDRAFLDLVPLNSFYLDERFVFFDQEFVRENYPVGVVIARVIDTFYAGNPELERILPSDTLYERYDLLKEKKRWLEMGWNFLRKLRQEDVLALHHAKVRRNEGALRANRRRMNYPEQEYRRIFIDIFQNADNKKLILFGSGKYAREFMNLYRVRYPVYAIVDNNEKVWGHEIHGVVIQPPELLAKLQSCEFKILICIRHFHPVMEQLDLLGIEDYSVFDPAKSYAIPRLGLPESSQDAQSKGYHIGYVAGVFDLFHIGHLNILRRAKGHCDYLIVGVVSDRQVREYKKVEPFVPFEERLDMVRSCRYVDEAHEIPFEHPDTDMAWKLYHFDVQFSGSDYEHDPVWLKKKEWLEARGSTMVFFPYTQSTSSTRLKKLIEERLI